MEQVAHKSPSQWDEEDLKYGIEISKELSNPNSLLSGLQQSLVILREREWAKAKNIKDPYEKFQQMGIVMGIDLAIARPHNIVEKWRDEVEARRHG